MLARRFGVSFNASTTGLTRGGGDTTGFGSGTRTIGLGTATGGLTGRLGVIISVEIILDEALEVCK